MTTWHFADQHPDHDTIASFRQEHSEALSGLFVQAVRWRTRGHLPVCRWAGAKMDPKRMGRHLVGGLLGGVIASVVYFGLEFTKRLHGFAVGALGPAINLVWHHLDPSCYTKPYCRLEILAANVALYAFWIFIVLMIIDVCRGLLRIRAHKMEPRS